MGGFLSGALTAAAGAAGGALLFHGIEGLLGHNPGPFTGAVMPGGRFLNNGTPTENNTETINNYYGEGEHPTLEGQQSDQASDQNDPDPDPVDYIPEDSNADFTSDDFGNNDSGFDGGSDDNSYV